MSLVIDFHTHVFPARFKRLLQGKSGSAVENLRKQARGWLRPFSRSLHHTQTVLRHLPDPARRKLDSLTSFAPLPGLLVESTAEDLREAMRDSGVARALVIAHPPFISNSFILETVAESDGAFIAGVNIPRGTRGPGTVLKRLHADGARVLKIHPAADGEGPSSPRYKALLKAATQLGMPVILHTGCIHSRMVYKSPELGAVEHFKPWFKSFPETVFVLAHMNFHDPAVALDLAQEFRNLYVDTSWQPAESIAEAVRRIGAERVLFGTDWPLVGNNISVGLRRVRECIESGLLKPEDGRLILGGNAERLLGPACPSNSQPSPPSS
ncbi:MAG: amidohydrolase family protein [Oligoflexia bacterium]|nr:amidohydrolase family protein [Oligoflexia bacterium]